MILPQRRWEQVLWRYTEEEKLEIQLAVTGHAAMQRGFIVDEKRLSPELLAKLKLDFLPLPVAFPARIARAAS